MADTFEKFTRNAKVCGYLVLDCALRVLIGGAGNLRARGHFILNSFGALNWADFVNAVFFRRGLTCTLGLTNDLIEGGQLGTKNGF